MSGLDEGEPTPAGRKQSDRWREWAAGNAGLLATALLGTLTLMRLARVSAGNETTALAILKYGGTGEALLASGLEILPFFAVLGTAYVLRYMLKGKDKIVYLPPFGILMFFSLFVVPVGILGLGIVAFFAFWRTGAERAVVAGMVLGLTFMALQAVLLTGEMWLPGEVVRTEKTSEVGYVLDEKVDRLVLLRDDNRRIVVIMIGDVRQRYICDVRRSGSWLDKAFERRVLDLFASEERAGVYPRCPR